MKEISFQKIDGKPVPYLEQDAESWSNYKENQVVSAKVKGYQKQRSVHQLGLLMACISLVVENTENENWNSVGRAKLSLKALLNYVDSSTVVVVNGKVVVQYLSFAFSQLRHMTACKLFDRAFPILADVIGLTEDELIAEAKSKMLDRGVRYRG